MFSSQIYHCFGREDGLEFRKLGTFEESVRQFFTVCLLVHSTTGNQGNEHLTAIVTLLCDVLFLVAEGNVIAIVVCDSFILFSSSF